MKFIFFKKIKSKNYQSFFFDRYFGLGLVRPFRPTLISDHVTKTCHVKYF